MERRSGEEIFIGWDYGHAGDYIDYKYKLEPKGHEKVWEPYEIFMEIGAVIKGIEDYDRYEEHMCYKDGE